MPAAAADPIEEVRRFNRFYTRAIGVLSEGHLGSEFSLVEVRVLYEIASRDRPTASAVAAELGLDAGYLSRILRRFERDGLVTRSRSRADGRQSHLALTRRGRARFNALDTETRGEIGRLLAPLSSGERGGLVAAMHTIEKALVPAAVERGSDAEAASNGEHGYVLRDPAPGDLGWVVSRHGALYGAEYGWNVEFEGMVARIVADFVEHFDPARERCWIAERDGEKLGSVFLVKESARVARLRMLLVEPSARGLGLGGHLVDVCTEFARRAGYRKIVLWTNSALVKARRLYERAGYRLTLEKRHHVWGKDQVSETWELDLAPARSTVRSAPPRRIRT